MVEVVRGCSDGVVVVVMVGGSLVDAPAVLGWWWWLEVKWWWWPGRGYGSGGRCSGNGGCGSGLPWLFGCFEVFQIRWYLGDGEVVVSGGMGSESGFGLLPW
ncbi:hypothetical protein QL285_021947 [Trifolium repens]|jgi:hypothetical protein|nr:hypothetical protein QL285_021947 [Trifolium repens]